MDNPFNPEKVRLQVPEGMGSTVSAEGWMVEADKDGCVEVPRRFVDVFKAHGLFEPGDKKPAKK